MAVRQEASPALGSPLLLEPYPEPAPPLATEDFDDLDEFEDAEEEHIETIMDLETAFEDCEVAIRRFFNNDITGALHIMQPWGRTSLYHSLGTSIFEFIPAILTFDHGQINRALAALKVTISICNQHRRNYTLVESIGTMIKKPNYGMYTDLEAHAELCYAEALLLQAAMTIMEGEDLAGLIRGTIKIKNCYNSYKECAKILDKKTWESEVSRVNFECGVRLGGGTFNVMISLLPPRIISLLEFVGFTGNKSFGLSELSLGSQSPGLRSVLCDLTLLAYQLVICHFTGGEGDLDACDAILERELEIYPDGVWFLLFKARLQFMRGQLCPAVHTYDRAVVSQDMWKQFTHVCYWEIMWINALQMEWRQAASFANILIEESSWSRTIYSYSRAAMLLQLDEDMKIHERTQASDLLRNASYYKQRIAGKSLPMEKFVIKRCARYQAQGRLVLPAVELLCLWNMFAILAKNERAAQDMLKLIEKTRTEFERGPQPWEAGYEADNRALLRFLHGSCLAAMGLLIEKTRTEFERGPQPWEAGYEADNRALLRFLHGSCLAAMGLPRMALDVLDSVFDLKSQLKEDTFLLPYSVAEVAMCHHRLGDDARATRLLQDARKKYSGYSLESRLHFRMHSKMQIIKAQTGNGK